MKTLAVRVLVVVVVALCGSAAAETIGAWNYTAPQEFSAVKKDTQHEYTRVDNKTFCLIGVYLPRAAGAQLDGDLNTEWATVVEAGFKVSEQTKYTAKKTKTGLTSHSRGGKLVNGSGTFYGQLVVIRERATVGSVFVLSNNAQTIGTCQPALTALTDSIAFASAAPAPATTSATTGLVAQWGLDTPLRSPGNDNWMHGYTRAQYDFKADSTYAFKKEFKFEGSPKTTFDNYVETGTYARDGDTLTITPKVSKHVRRDIDGKVLETNNVALEKVAYAVKVEPGDTGRDETLLLITPSKQTLRDGSPNGGTYLPGGYIYSNRKQMFWKY